MFNLRKLFKKEKTITEQLQIVVPQISEPVYSFVQTVKENPKRFRITSIWSLDYTEYTLEDKVEILFWTADRVRWYSCMDNKPYFYYLNYPKFLTESEVKYIFKELESVFKERASKFLKLQTIRKERAAQKERQKLIDIYCKEK